MFDISELHEWILLELPVKKIFVVKAVAKQCGKLIQRSILLKREYDYQMAA